MSFRMFFRTCLCKQNKNRLEGEGKSREECQKRPRKGSLNTKAQLFLTLKKRMQKIKRTSGLLLSVLERCLGNNHFPLFPSSFSFTQLASLPSTTNEASRRRNPQARWRARKSEHKYRTLTDEEWQITYELERNPLPAYPWPWRVFIVILLAYKIRTCCKTMHKKKTKADINKQTSNSRSQEKSLLLVRNKTDINKIIWQETSHSSQFSASYPGQKSENSTNKLSNKNSTTNFRTLDVW